MDFDKYNERPTSRYLQNLGVTVLNPELTQTTELYIRSNVVEAKDGLIQIGLEGDEYEFYDVLDRATYYQKSDGKALLAVQCILA